MNFVSEAYETSCIYVGLTPKQLNYVIMFVQKNFILFNVLYLVCNNSVSLYYRTNQLSRNPVHYILLKNKLRS